MMQLLVAVTCLRTAQVCCSQTTLSTCGCVRQHNAAIMRRTRTDWLRSGVVWTRPLTVWTVATLPTAAQSVAACAPSSVRHTCCSYWNNSCPCPAHALFRPLSERVSSTTFRPTTGVGPGLADPRPTLLLSIHTEPVNPGSWRSRQDPGA